MYPQQYSTARGHRPFGLTRHNCLLAARAKLASSASIFLI